MFTYFIIFFSWIRTSSWVFHGQLTFNMGYSAIPRCVDPNGFGYGNIYRIYQMGTSNDIQNIMVLWMLYAICSKALSSARSSSPNLHHGCVFCCFLAFANFWRREEYVEFLKLRHRGLWSRCNPSTESLFEAPFNGRPAQSRLLSDWRLQNN